MNYTEIITAIIGLLVALITTIVAPAVRAFLSERVEKEKLERWEKFVGIAVAAAEQTIPPELWQEKKEFVREWLNERGIEYDVEAVDGMIEAAVIKLHNELKVGAEE